LPAAAIILLLGRAPATPNPIARFIKHVKLRLLQRYIEPDILRHWLPSGCCVATTKLYPSRNKSSVIGPCDYRHVLLFAIEAFGIAKLSVSLGLILLLVPPS